MKVLAPNMPESGLVDACKQVKQAAISSIDNYEKLEQAYTALREQTIELRKQWLHALRAHEQLYNPVYREFVEPDEERFNRTLSSVLDQVSEKTP